MRAIWIVLVLVSCYRRSELCSEDQDPDPDRCGGAPEDAPADTGDADAPIDTPPDSFATCAGTLVGSSIVKVCVPAGVGANVGIGAGFDTSNPANCDELPTIAGAETCVRWAEKITISQKIRFTGSRPLVLAATDSITFAAGAGIDVHSTAAGGIGAGATRDDCDSEHGLDVDGGGGGAGGSFRTQGARGGQGLNGAPGGASKAGPVLAFRVGCHGGRGGADPTVANGGLPGGAVFLVAGGSITLNDGVINASGGGGREAASRGGGAGGGSGGFIGLDAPIIVIGTATLFALGGGGSPGGTPMQPGPRGDDPSGPTAPAIQTPSPAVGPGAGGAGAGGNDPPEAGGNVTSSMLFDGGGGGGGGNGFIGWISGTAIPNNNPSIAPPPTALPDIP